MKQIIFLFILTSLSINVFGQFPTPINFSVTVEYIETDGMGWTDCGGTVLYAPAYCTRISWSAPDTNSIESNLVKYNVYLDNNLLFSVDKNIQSENTCGALTGYFYITATYANPVGESDKSNIIFISNNLPIGLTDNIEDKEFTVLFNESAHRIEITNYKIQIKSIALYDSSGRLVLISKNRDYLMTHELSKGIYIIEITDTKSRTRNQKIKIN